MTRKDALGVEVEVGDIIFSSPKGGRGEVGKVVKVHDSGRITIKIPCKSTIYAFQRGAPKIEREGVRIKQESDGRYAYEEYVGPNGRTYRRTVYEKYTYMENDYTTVGHEWTWIKTQAADISILVLRKQKRPLSIALLNALAMDYETDAPQLD